jgi:hypothetical protein
VRLTRCGAIPKLGKLKQCQDIQRYLTSWQRRSVAAYLFLKFEAKFSQNLKGDRTLRLFDSLSAAYPPLNKFKG